MPKTKKKKFTSTKKIISAKDDRKIIKKKERIQKKEKAKEEIVSATAESSAMFFSYNTQLGPPFHILIDTNFINFSIQNKLDIFESLMDCLYAKCTPYITDCVMGELEKMQRKYRVAIKISKDPRFERLPCDHKGTFADDCLVERIKKHKCYIVATCDADLKRRIRKIPGVPIMSIKARKYSVERLPGEAWNSAV